ncbi:hypothetical protein A9X04_13840 [Mycobacterium sp. E3247]|nr:hypothetical protein A9X04_13840 [Mycobacterium sp. E3247]
MDDSPALYSESTYSFLNRAAGEKFSRIRSLLEDWFTHYPDEHKEQLRNSLTVSDQGLHLGAWWELYTYSLYRCLGYSIEIHPSLDGVETRPDFLVTRESQSMYVECTVVSATDGPVTTNPGIEAAIYDAINEISNPNFLIGLEFKQEGKQQPRRRQIKTEIGNWLEGLDPDEVLAQIDAANAIGELGEPPEKDFTFHDWVFTCTAYPSSPDKRREGRRLLGALPQSGVFVIRNTERIHEAVRTKGRRYGAPGSLDRPLIVAVLSVNNFAEIADATDAMFGSTAITYIEGDPSSVKRFRQRNGYWRGPDSSRGARVSAVLFSHDMQPWSVASHLPIVVINPWADNRIEGHPPLTTITITDQGEIVETLSPTTPQDVFGSNI